MRPYAIVGLVLVLIGVLALVVRSVTYFTTDHVVGPLGFFAWDVDRPHTMLISPLAGVVAVAVGAAFIYISRGAKRV